MKLICCLSLTLLIVVYLFLIRNKKEHFAYNKIDMKKYKIHHYDDDCILRCGNVSDCVRLKHQDANYKKCKTCKKDNNNKYIEDITGYNCLSNDIVDDGNDVKCDYNEGMSCPNYNDIANPKMVRPYYIMPKHDEEKLSNTGLCQFCWTIN